MFHIIVVRYIIFVNFKISDLLFYSTRCPEFTGQNFAGFESQQNCKERTEFDELHTQDELISNVAVVTIATRAIHLWISSYANTSYSAGSISF